jgi:ribosomal protein S18 acetylase RimI-like enzyme
VNVRDAKAADRERLRELYTAFVRELPPRPRIPLDLEHELGELDEYLGDEHVALVAEEKEGAVIGFALARIGHPGLGHLNDIYVVPEARRRGVARELIREVTKRLRDEGAVVLTLGVQVDNTGARTVYERLGFELESFRLYAPVETLLAEDGDQRGGQTFGSVHVQTDDVAAVESAVRKYVPRLGRSAGSLVSAPQNGWTAVYDELSDRDPKLLRRLASELSNATGAVAAAFSLEQGEVVRYVLIDRGRVVDEYLSVPEYYGSLPPGDVIALAANPTVVARLTGADPARVRAVARTAAAPSELPLAPDLLAQVAAAFGIEGADQGYADAARLAGAVALEHG